MEGKPEFHEKIQVGTRPKTDTLEEQRKNTIRSTKTPILMLQSKPAEFTEGQKRLVLAVPNMQQKIHAIACNIEEKSVFHAAGLPGCCH